MGLFDAIAGVFGIGAGDRARPRGGVARGVDESIAMSTGTLLVDVESGNVVVQGWDRDVVRVTAGDQDGRLKLAYERSGDVVTLLGLAGDGGLEVEDVDYVISVPSGVAVRVRSDCGDIVGRRIGASFDVESTSGNVAVNEVRGPLTVRTESGDVAVAGLAADVQIESESGNVALRANHAPRVRVTLRTESGDIAASAIGGVTLLESASGNISAVSARLGPDDTLTVLTESGDMSVSIPGGMPVTLDVTSECGDVASDLGPATRSDDGHLALRLHGGGARVLLASESGSIALRAR